MHPRISSAFFSFRTERAHGAGRSGGPRRPFVENVFQTPATGFKENTSALQAVQSDVLPFINDGRHGLDSGNRFLSVQNDDSFAALRLVNESAQMILCFCYGGHFHNEAMIALFNEACKPYFLSIGLRTEC